MSLLFVFSSVLIPSCSLLVPAWLCSLPFGSRFGPQTGSQNGYRNGPFLKPAGNHPNTPQTSHFLCCFLGVGGSFGRSTAAETPLFDIPSLLLFVPHFVFGHLNGPQPLSLLQRWGWRVPSVKGTAENEDLLSWALLNARWPLL